MALLFILMLLVVLDLAALKFGADSRPRTGESPPRSI
jgi:hypothetical protein